MLFKLTFSTVLFMSILGAAAVAWADEPGASALGPLDDGALLVSGQIEPLTVIAENINDDLAAAQSPSEDVIDFSEMPLIKEFVDEEGQFGLPLDLPISINLGGEGGYSVGVGASF
jgi:hypothetical protein